MPRRAHLAVLDHLRRIHEETHTPVTASQLADATGKSLKTIYNYVTRLNKEDLIVTHGDSTYEPAPPPPPAEPMVTPPEPPPAPDAPTMTTDDTKRRAAALDAEAERLRARCKKLVADHRAAIKRHDEASTSYMEGTGSTAEDVQHEAGLVATINKAIDGIDARLATLAEEGREIAREIERSRHVEAAADAAKRALSARRDFFDRFASAYPEVVQIGRGILNASDAYQDACADFYRHGIAAGLPPLDEAEVTVSTKSESGVVSSKVVPASGVQDVLGLVVDRLAEGLSIPEAEAALAAAQEGHRLGDSPLTRDLHHTPLWTRTPATQPPGGEPARLLVRSLIDLAREAGDQDARSQA